MAIVEVSTGSRIHITLIDMNSTVTGRVDGGIGFMVERPSVVVRSQPSTEASISVSPSVDVESRDEILAAIRSTTDRLRDAFGSGPAQIDIKECPRTHAGLGAKTQVLLATCVAVARCYERQIDIGQLGRMTGRGGTSGIGLYGFQLGGFIVDGGHAIPTKGGPDPYRPSSLSSSAGSPPLIARYELPDWPVLVITPLGYRIHGSWEAQLFKEVCPVPMDDVQSVSHIVLMQILPAIVEHDLAAFGAGLWAIQDRRWKAFEIGSQTPQVQSLITRLREDLRVTGVAMSSWGTTVVCVDERLIGTARDTFLKDVQALLDAETDGGSVMLTRTRNHPASVAVVG